MKKKWEGNIWENILMLIMFCFSISLFNKTGYFFAGTVVLMFFLYLKKIRVTIPVIILLIFSMTYFVFYIRHDELTVNSVIIYLFGPWCAYILGKTYVECSLRKNAFMELVISLSLGMWLHGMLNWIAYLRSEHAATYEHYRLAVDIWRGDIVSVTVTGMFFTFAAAISIGVLFSNVKRMYKYMAGIVVVSCFVVTVFFANRTLLLIMAVLFCWRGLGVLFSQKESGRTKLFIITMVVITLLLFFVVFSYNIAGIRDWVMSLKIVQRFLSGESGGRTKAWSYILRDNNWLKYPWGGRYIVRDSFVSYLHNLWLDIYNVVGIVPFAALVAFTALYVGRFFHFSKFLSNNDRFDENKVIQCLMIALVLNSAVEPVIDANPYYFLTCLVFLGAMEGEMHRRNTVK